MRIFDFFSQNRRYSLFSLGRIYSIFAPRRLLITFLALLAALCAPPMRSTEIVFVAPNGDRYVIQNGCEPVRFTLGPDPVYNPDLIPCFGLGHHPLAIVAAAASGDNDAYYVPELDGRQFMPPPREHVPEVQKEPETISERIAIVLKEGQRMMTRDEICKALEARFPEWVAIKNSVSATLTRTEAFKVAYSSPQTFSL